MYLNKALMILTISIFSLSVNAGSQFIENLSIEKVRAVGNYHVGDTYDGTIEIWFTTDMNFAATVNCEKKHKVFVDASNNHMVSAAYMAFATGKKVSVHIDDSLPIRSGSCEISYLDVLN